MAMGRPLTLSTNIATKNISATATAGQTNFTVTNGYRINQLGVYRNGTRLVDGSDFLARDGSTVQLQSAAVAGDVIEFRILDSFNVSDAINASDTGMQTINSDLNVGSAITMIKSGGNKSGIVSAGFFFGDGSNLDGIVTDALLTIAVRSGTAVTFAVDTDQFTVLARSGNVTINI